MFSNFKNSIRVSFLKIKKDILGLADQNKALSSAVKRIERNLSEIKDRISSLEKNDYGSDVKKIKKEVELFIKAKDFFKIISKVEDSINELNESFEEVKLSSNIEIFNDVKKIKTGFASLKRNVSSFIKKSELTIEEFRKELSAKTDLDSVKSLVNSTAKDIEKKRNVELKKLKREIETNFKKEISSAKKIFEREFSELKKNLDLVINEHDDTSKRSMHNFNEINRLSKENAELRRMLKEINNELKKKYDRKELKAELKGLSVKFNKQTKEIKKSLSDVQKASNKRKQKRKEAEIRTKSEVKRVEKKKDQKRIKATKTDNIIKGNKEANLNNYDNAGVRFTHKAEDAEVYIQPWTKISGYKRVKKKNNNL